MITLAMPDRRTVVRIARRLFAGAVGLTAAVLPLHAGLSASGVLDLPWLPAGGHAAHARLLLAGDAPSRETGRQWLAGAEAALFEPAAVALPYEETLALDGSPARAIGLSLAVAAGHRLRVTVAGQDAAHALFIELFDVSGAAPVAVGAVPWQRGQAPTRTLEWNAAEDSELVLRVQGAAGYAGDVAVTVADEPWLGFPVTGHSMRSIQSGFGADRDGGRRAHRGVDIFADRGTEVVAAVDGFAYRVDTTPRGGNVVWLAPIDGNLRLYYAHLDSQLVRDGDFVLAGDVIGTVGNTGNAITTPPHLHFGVYLRRRGVRGGARDPVGFLR